MSVENMCAPDPKCPSGEHALKVKDTIFEHTNEGTFRKPKFDGVYRLHPVPIDLLVYEELSHAREKHPPINSLHEGYAVIMEEVEEFWEEVKKRKENRDPEKMYCELIQIAAMALRVAEDCIAKPN